MKKKTQLAAGSGSSIVVEECQVCGCKDLKPATFLGYMPPVNQMRTIGEKPAEQPAYPALLLQCPKCLLVQLGLIVDPAILFPPEYPYTSGTTRILRENFAALYEECTALISLDSEDLVVDIGSNDGTLLSNFKNGGHRVHGIEPAEVGRMALERDIPTTITFFGEKAVKKLVKDEGKAKVITATNVFAHMENIHAIMDAILMLLEDDGLFISESHYLMSLLETLQYDTVYHEHLRYYSLHSLKYLLEMHGMEIIHARPIPTHGGSIRVYAARKDVMPVRPSVKTMLAEEKLAGVSGEALENFGERALQSKLRLYALLAKIHEEGGRIYGIGAPSRASTLINYTGLDEGIIDCVLEVPGSHKIGKYMPGTIIPVESEQRLFDDPPEYALLLSWHIAEELIPKLRAKGFAGGFIVPLPEPRIVEA